MFWYLQHPNELLIDLDDAMRDTDNRNGKSNGPWIEIFFRRRLREAIASGKLKVRDIYLARSATNGHFQAVIRLRDDNTYHNSQIGQIWREIWQLYLGSDLYRARADLMRCVTIGFDYSNSLLILPEKIPDFYRTPDAICDCIDKHTRETDCRIFQRFRGLEMTEMFGPKRKDREKFVPLPLGRVPLELILKREL